MATHTVQIGNRTVGDGRACYVIAEVGVNHNGSAELALKLVEAAAATGADAVKFQTFTAASLASAAAPKAACQLRTTSPHESQRDMLATLELSHEAHRVVHERCQALGIEFLSSPFDEASADFLETLDVAAFKIPSGEITNLPFLAHVANKARPMIVSTGMSDLGEVESAVQTVESAGNQDVILLHCVSDYPAEPSQANLRAMATLAAAFGTLVGYSDHTPGASISLAAAALGACVIEKHLTLDRALPGPDQATSLEPDEFAFLVREIRSIESALGDGRKRITQGERDTVSAVRKSLVARVDIHAGARLTPDMLTAKRPGLGLAPGLRDELMGRVARVDIPEDTCLTREMFE